MRGYGGTDQPPLFSSSSTSSPPPSNYTQPVIARDVREIATALGYDKFVVIGHDWGCQAAWSVALLYPKDCIGVCGISIPYVGMNSQKQDYLSWLEDKYGPCLDPSLPDAVRRRGKFHYILHHCLDESHTMYDENCHEFLYRIYGYRPGCQVEDGTPEYDINGPMFVFDKERQEEEEEVDTSTPDIQGPEILKKLDAHDAPGLWKRIPRPTNLPSWFTVDDLEYICREYERSGFYGGLCWYRALRQKFHLMKQELQALRNDQRQYQQKDKRKTEPKRTTTTTVQLDDTIYQPSMFIMGKNDYLMKLYGGEDEIRSRIRSSMVHLLEKPIFVDGAGHWVQIEAHKDVNTAIHRFLNHVYKNLVDDSGIGTRTADLTNVASNGQNMFSCSVSNPQTPITRQSKL
jgi:pimeloyl-ACP methyl ester carboxylesterase